MRKRKSIDKLMVISNPIPSHNKSPIISVSKLLKLSLELFKKVSFVSANVKGELNRELGEKVEVIDIKYTKGKNMINKIYNMIKMQMKTIEAIKNKVDRKTIALFWIGDKMILPYIWCKLKGCTVLYFLMGNVECEGKTNISIKKKLSKFLIELMASKADYICIESPSVIEQWKKFKNRENVLNINLFVDENKFRKEVNWEDRDNIVGMLTRLSEGKHVLEAIKGFHEFNRMHENKWKLQIIGDGPLREKCEQLIEVLGDKNIELLGWIDNSDINNFLNNWRLNLFPTSAEGLPNSLIECMFCGVPSITTSVGGIKDIVQDNVNGWILEETSADCIKDKLEYVVNIEDLNNISERAYISIKSKYSFESSKNNMVSQINKIVRLC